MDPNATLNRIFELINDEDWEEAFYACLDLKGWLLQGGFIPTAYNALKPFDREELLGFIKVTMDQCKRLSVGSFKEVL